MASQHNTRSLLHVPGRVAGAIALTALFSSTGFAQSSSLQDDENFINFYSLTEPDDHWKIGVGFSAQDEGDFNKLVGDLSISRAFYELWYEWPEEGHSKFAIGFVEEHSNYDIDGASALGLAPPFREVKNSSLSATYLNGDEDGSWALNSSLTFGREQGVSPTEGLYGQATVAKLWSGGDSFDFGLGLYTYSKLEDSTEFLPFPVFNWRVSDSVTLGLLRSSSPEYGLLFNLSDRWDAYLVANYNVRQYRLADRTGISSGSVVDEDLNGRAGLIWSGDSLRFEVFGGLSRHKISIESQNNLFARDVSDPAPLIGANFSVSL